MQHNKIHPKYCVHMLINLKMLSVETILGMGEEEDKGE
jgi:hypothetical protein